jgi:hypothetical protein
VLTDEQRTEIRRGCGRFLQLYGHMSIADELASLGSVTVELPLRDADLQLPSWDELSTFSATARERGARVHLDGARLWESADHLGHTLAEIAALADSVYVSFYKILGAMSVGEATMTWTPEEVTTLVAELIDSVD